jgi:hypothetical protein
MKKFAAVLLLLLCSTTLIYGQKTRFGEFPPRAKKGVDYPIAVHIVATHIRQNCQYDWKAEILGGPRYDCPEVVYLDAVFNGKKVELMGQRFQKLVISPGDYQARPIKNDPNANLAVMGQKYELLSPDKYVWRCIVTGVSE